MSPIKDHKELRIWQHSMLLTAHIYDFCKSIPSTERFGIISQMQRSAVSIPSNISEGYSRGTRKDYLHFLHIARGSAAELETQVILSGVLFPNIKNVAILPEIESMRKMLSALIKGLETK